MSMRPSWLSSSFLSAAARAIGFVGLAALFFVFLGVNLSVAPGYAPLKSAQAAEPAIPEMLKPWVGWVSEEIPNFGCTYVGDAKVCDWPGKLNLRVDSSGANFTLEVWRDTPGNVALPGNQKIWPQNVRSNTAAIAVHGTGQPLVHLKSGHHTVSGRLIWSEMPEFINVSRETGMLSLEINGKTVEHPRVDGESRLWLREGQDGTVTETDSLRVATYRRIGDGVPLQITTNLELTVAGRAREVQLGKVLIAGSRATKVSGALPIQIDADGTASVFVRPGTHIVRIDSVVASHDQTALEAPEHSAGIFEPQETWAWYPDEKLRSVTLEGLTAVDPARTTLPPEWRGGSTFLAEPGQKLTLTETRRGIVDTPPNVLELHREIWFDLDGKGATSSDKITGIMHRDWRLNYGESARIGRVAQDGTDLLITESNRISGTEAAKSLQGVELRNARVNINADIRIEHAPTKLQIVGWKHDVSKLSAKIHLPPGWSLLGGSGVDKMHGTWLGSWTLLDFFFVLIVAMGFGKLYGWRWGLVAALALCLSHNTIDAPRWIWVNLLIALALLRVITRGNVRRAIVAYRGVTLLFLFISLTMFIRMQIREATHPQAIPAYTYNSSTFFANDYAASTAQTVYDNDTRGGMAAAESSDMEAEINEREEEQYLEKKVSLSRTGKNLSYAGKSAPGKADLQQIDPRAVVQTGPGVPTWTWRSWNLSWSGPVNENHVIKLWIISPLQNALIIAVRITLLLLLALLAISRRDMYWRDPEETGSKDVNKSPKTPKTPKNPGLAPTIALILTAAFANLTVFGAPTNADAQEIPSSEVLNALKSRIENSTRCDGPCVTASRVDITVNDLDFTMRADVHAQQTAGWALPGPEDPLRILEVRVDGRPTTELRRTSQGLLAVRLTPGAHNIEVRARLINRSVATIQFDPATHPRLATFNSTQWSVDGIDPQGVPNSSLQLTRQIDEKLDEKLDTDRAPKSASDTQASRELPTWYSVERNVAFGLPWQIRTTITRVSAERPQSLRYPLLKGEAVISEGRRVETGHVLIEFARDEISVEFISEIPIAPSIELVAPTNKPWTEVWQVDCSRIWRCDFDGLAPLENVQSDQYLPRWFPWPGEKLRIDINRPEGSDGQATTIENVTYTTTPGKRLLQASLDLQIRSSRGEWLAIALPEGAELQQVQLNGTATSIRPRENIVNLAIQPGSQQYRLEWQQPWEHKFYEKMPTLDIGSPAVNTNLAINLSSDRWLLWVRGPSWGPAVLFWSHLVFLLIVAGLLGQWQLSPIRTYEWLLLAIGMSQLPVFALVPVVGFFILFNARKTTQLEPAWKFNLFQLALIGLTFVALGCLYAAIHTNLLFDVDMQVEGAQSYNSLLRWYVDRTIAVLPEAGVISFPIWVWRGLMLLWALWLSWRLIHWLPWAWRCFSEHATWKKMTLATNRANNVNPLQRTIVRPQPAGQQHGEQPTANPAPEPNNKPEPPPADN